MSRISVLPQTWCDVAYWQFSSSTDKPILKNPKRIASHLGEYSMSMKRAKCPACKEIIEFGEKIKVQGLVSCPNCKLLLELVQDFPLKLDWAEDPQVHTQHWMYIKFY